MAIFDKEIIENFSALEKVRNMQLERCNIELEKICKMPEEEKINAMDKMRILLRLKELYEELDIKVIEGEVIFYKGNAVITEKELTEIYKLGNKCYEEEKKYTELIGNEEFILNDIIKAELEDYIKIREIMLEGYIKNSINAVFPQLCPQSAFLMNSKEYYDLIQLFSELNISISDKKVYVNEIAVEKKRDYLSLAKKINNINKVALQFIGKFKL